MMMIIQILMMERRNYQEMVIIGRGIGHQNVGKIGGSLNQRGQSNIIRAFDYNAWDLFIWLLLGVFSI